MLLTEELQQKVDRGEITTSKFLDMLREDLELFCDVCLKIQTKAGDLKNFRFNRPQKYFLEIVHKQLQKTGRIRLIILKGRQLGISTLIEALLFQMVTTKHHQNAKVIAHTYDATEMIFEMAKRFHKYMPPWARPMTTIDNRGELSFNNPSRKPEEQFNNPGLDSSFGVFTAGSKGQGRGGTIRALHCSEVPYWEGDASKIMLGLLNAVPKTGQATRGTMVFIESTAKGVGDYFYKKYHAAKAAMKLGELNTESVESGFWAVFLPWYLHDEYQSEVPFDFAPTEEERRLMEEEQEGWDIVNPFTGKKTLSATQIMFRRHTIANDCDGDLNMFRQEYPLFDEEAFITSGASYFDIEGVNARKKAIIEKGIAPVFVGEMELEGVDERRKKGEPPQLTPTSYGRLHIWRQPEEKGEYVYFADVGHGVRGGDNSVITVLDLETGYQCAVWRGIIAPDKLADAIYELGRYYNWAYGTPETNGHGISTMVRLRNLRYKSLYLRLAYHKHSSEPTEMEGWQTNLKTRPLMLDTLKKMFREDIIVVNDLETLDEMLTFILNDSGKFEAQDGCHDDHVFALAGACRMMVENKSPLRKSKRKGEEFRRFRGHHRYDIDPVTGY